MPPVTTVPAQNFGYQNITQWAHDYAQSLQTQFLNGTPMAGWVTQQQFNQWGIPIPPQNERGAGTGTAMSYNSFYDAAMYIANNWNTVGSNVTSNFSNPTGLGAPDTGWSAEDEAGFEAGENQLDREHDLAIQNMIQAGLDRRAAMDAASAMSTAQIHAAATSQAAAAQAAATVQAAGINAAADIKIAEIGAAVNREDIAMRERVSGLDRTSREGIAAADRAESGRQFDLGLGEDRRQFNTTMLMGLFDRGVELAKAPVDWVAYQYYLQNLGAPLSYFAYESAATTFGAIPPTGPSAAGPVVGGPGIIDGDNRVAQQLAIQNPGPRTVSEAVSAHPGQGTQMPGSETMVASATVERMGGAETMDTQLAQARQTELSQSDASPEFQQQAQTVSATSMNQRTLATDPMAAQNQLPALPVDPNGLSTAIPNSPAGILASRERARNRVPESEEERARMQQQLEQIRMQEELERAQGVEPGQARPGPDGRDPYAPVSNTTAFGNLNPEQQAQQQAEAMARMQESIANGTAPRGEPGGMPQGPAGVGAQVIQNLQTGQVPTGAAVDPGFSQQQQATGYTQVPGPVPDLLGPLVILPDGTVGHDPNYQPPGGQETGDTQVDTVLPPDGPGGTIPGPGGAPPPPAALPPGWNMVSIGGVGAWVFIDETGQITQASVTQNGQTVPWEGPLPTVADIDADNTPAPPPPPPPPPAQPGQPGGGLLNTWDPSSPYYQTPKLPYVPKEGEIAKNGGATFRRVGDTWQQIAGPPGSPPPPANYQPPAPQPQTQPQQQPALGNVGGPAQPAPTGGEAEWTRDAPYSSWWQNTTTGEWRNSSRNPGIVQPAPTQPAAQPAPVAQPAPAAPVTAAAPGGASDVQQAIQERGPVTNTSHSSPSGGQVGGIYTGNEAGGGPETSAQPAAAGQPSSNFDQLINQLAQTSGIPIDQLRAMFPAHLMGGQYSQETLANSPIIQALREGTPLSQFNTGPQTGSPFTNMRALGIETGVRGGQDVNATMLASANPSQREMIQGAIQATGQYWPDFLEQSMRASPLTNLNVGSTGRRRFAA